MPLAVKFSEDFYRKLGHEAVDELVNWFNQVDSTYRGDLRELNEVNFARFDAKLEQRVADLRAELREGIAELRGEFRAQLGELRGDFRAQLEAEGKMLIRWMVGLWIMAGAALYFFPLGRP